MCSSHCSSSSLRCACLLALAMAAGNDGASGSTSTSMHMAMIPWLAVGHLLPFAELAERMARQGHTVSLLTTPMNIRRIPKVPASLAHLLHLVELPFPAVDGLPGGVESTGDLKSEDQRVLLWRAFDKLQLEVESFLDRQRPDWVLADFSTYWAPAVAAQFNIPCAFVCLPNAAFLCYYGPTSVLLGVGNERRTPKDLARVPDWVPFPNIVVLREYEARRLLAAGSLSPKDQAAGDVTEEYRLGKLIEGCSVIAVRSSEELEPEWLQLVRDLHGRPVLPLGFFPPLGRSEDIGDKNNGGGGGGDMISLFLDQQQRDGSVIFAAFGTEAKLTAREAEAIALGLEKAGLPFILALRTADGGSAADLLPGFEDRIEGGGVLCTGWVPQIRILRHRATGVFLTHCGWNSLIEGIASEKKMVLLPVIQDQGLNARLMTEKGIGVELPRDMDDGSFTAEDVSATLKMVSEDADSGEFGARARKFAKVFGDEEKNNRHLAGFLEFLSQHKMTSSGKVVADAGSAP